MFVKENSNLKEKVLEQDQDIRDAKKETKKF